MSDADNWSANFAGPGMQEYEQLLVARMFEPWGERLIDNVGIGGGQDVIDVACGPGSVTRLAAGRVGEAGSVIGCDLNATMLAIARGKPPVPAGARIEYRECPADALDADDDCCDVVTCQQGLQFFPDRLAALREMHRILRPGGRVGIAVWAHIDTCPPFAAIAVALEETLGRDTATGFRSGPWGLPEPDRLRAEVEAAGFGAVRVDTENLPIVFEGGTEQLLATLAAAPVGQTVAALDAEDRAALLRALNRATAPMTEGGEIRSVTTSNTAVAVA